MSISETISSWRQKSEIDYFSLFVPLWLAFDAWFKDKYSPTTDRDCLEELKNDEINNRTYHRMKDLLQGIEPTSETFKDYLTHLDQALQSAPIKYERASIKILSFSNGLVKRENDSTNDIYENLMRTSGQHNKIELASGIFITDEIPKIYRAYIEILYQVRCKLFHGDLKPNRENERTVKYLYLTLKAITNEI